MTAECPTRISNCGQLFRPFGAYQYSVANVGAAHPEIYMKTRLGAALYADSKLRHVIRMRFRDMTDLSRNKHF